MAQGRASGVPAKDGRPQPNGRDFAALSGSVGTPDWRQGSARGAAGRNRAGLFASKTRFGTERLRASVRNRTGSFGSTIGSELNGRQDRFGPERLIRVENRFGTERVPQTVRNRTVFSLPEEGSELDVLFRVGNGFGTERLPQTVRNRTRFSRHAQAAQTCATPQSVVKCRKWSRIW